MTEILSGYENGDLVPVEASHEDVAAIDQFAALLDDETREEVKALAQGLAFRMAADMVRRAMLYIIDDPIPKLAVDIIGSSFGLRLRQGISDTELAARYGISKEAFDQRKKRFLKGLGLKRIRVRGSKKETNTYRNANYRNYKRTLS